MCRFCREKEALARSPEVKLLRARVRLLEDIVRDLSEHEDEPCSLDHHGYCQEHGWFGDSPCPIARAKEAL